jgi:peptidyl-prolyl cis-trans isomerase C
MKRMTVFTLIISVLFLFASCAKHEEKKGPYLATVGKAKITQEDIDREMKNLPPFAQKIFEGSEGKERFLNELVKKELLYQEALKQGLDKDAAYIEKVADFKKITLISQLLENEIEEKAKVTEEDVKNYYDEHKEDFSPFDQIRLSIIRVKTGDEARKISEKLKEGEDFAKIAKESSIDSNSAKVGGDLGFLSRDQISPEHEMAVARMMKGEVSDPVRTQQGFDIIKVTDKKTKSVVEFEKVKDLISQHLSAEKQKEVFDSYIDGLKKTYTVEINREALAGPSPEEMKEPAEKQIETETKKEIEKAKDTAKEVETETKKEMEKAQDTAKEIEKKIKIETKGETKEAQEAEQQVQPQQAP